MGLGPLGSNAVAPAWPQTLAVASEDVIRERQERITPFVVDPDKVKQAAEIRAARLAAREKKASARVVVHDE